MSGWTCVLTVAIVGAQLLDAALVARAVRFGVQAGRVKAAAEEVCAEAEAWFVAHPERLGGTL